MRDYFDSSEAEPYRNRAISLIDDWLPNDTPRHVRQGLVRLLEMEEAVYRFVELKSANLYELKRAWQRLDDVEQIDNDITKKSQKWLDDFWERNSCVLPPFDGSRHPMFHNDSEYIWCGEMSVDCKIPPGFWRHVEIVLGARLPERFQAKRFVSGE